MKKHIPNTITCCNLICGCIATYCAFHHGHQVAFLFILLGAVFDFFDGMTARALGVSGKLGVELDSLADCVTFGVAPSAMMFTLFNHVAYPELMANEVFFNVMPFTAFIMAAFSALRLAKFNIDERQHTGFIGMPTPANAIFWGALISSSEEWLTSPRFNAFFLFMFMVLACWLLVCEVPMFAFKFKNMSWEDNKIKYIYLIAAVAVLVCSGIMGAAEGFVWQSLCRGVACCIGLYVAMSIVASYLPKKD
ncbi:MAG: CDP-diacylglycerol--serine O-phosphatidyltransferase [Prevotellaceae bacterium]|nr:CDP-diacylglycerol--serine O-phosphatidyltransferase [Candidatus Minthosoma caballi]